jgi:hypothetical protein
MGFFSHGLTGVFRQADETFSTPSAHSCRWTAVIYLTLVKYTVFIIATHFTFAFFNNRKYLLLIAISLIQEHSCLHCLVDSLKSFNSTLSPKLASLKTNFSSTHCHH